MNLIKDPVENMSCFCFLFSFSVHKCTQNLGQAQKQIVLYNALIT